MTPTTTFLAQTINKLENLGYDNNFDFKQIEARFSNGYDTDIAIYRSENFRVIAKISEQTYELETVFSNLKINEAFLLELEALKETFID